MTKWECPQCGHSLAVLHGQPPEPGSVAELFGGVMVSAVAAMSTPMWADDPCPHCGCPDVFAEPPTSTTA